MKKKMLYLSFIPLLISLLIFIYELIFGNIDYNTIFNSNIIEMIDAFRYEMAYGNRILYFLCMVGFTYQMYYIFSKRCTYRKKLLYISLVPWIIYIGVCIYYYFVGYKECFVDPCLEYYKFEALYEAGYHIFYEYSALPILPPTLSIIIAYIIDKLVRYIKYHKE